MIAGDKVNLTMRPTLFPLTALAACATLLGGCGMLDNIGGTKKVSPDEFKIVSHSPLTMPPNAELRPPRPGEPRPQEVTPADQAREALNPAAARTPRGQARAPASAEAALVTRAGQGGVDPNIRSRVNTDSRTIAADNESFIDALIFWQDKPPPGVVLDPAKEQQRLRDAQAAGRPATGGTPTIERRKRGWLEGIF
jgi:hypothetical protein